MDDAGSWGLMTCAAQQTTWTCISRSEAQTVRLGEAIGKTARARDVVALIGPLGVGKTQMARGIACGLGVPDAAISSPTFTLLQTYAGCLSLHHIDLYRWAGDEVGLSEAIEGDGVAVVEWADRGMDLLPMARLILTLRYAEGDLREIVLTGDGPRGVAWLAQLEQIWKTSEHGR